MRHFGLFGRNISYSLSPILHGEIIRQCGVEADYTLLDSDDLHLPFQKFSGFNVTIPHKRAIVPFLDEDKSLCGSVNTVTREKGRLVGYSTDGEGFLRDAKRLSFSLENVLIIGTGGGAASIAAALKTAGARVSVVGREGREGNLIDRFGCLHYNEGENFSLAINCLPFAYDFAGIRAESYYNLLYNLPCKKGENGLGMLVYQAIAAAEIMYGVQADGLFDALFSCLKAAKK